MTSGIVFDIKEFAVHDGPGIRTTVFLKGCPLSCSWCHNPEGLSSEPEIIQSTIGDRLVGTQWTSEDLARRLRNHTDILASNGGGVTFSGGEPLNQARFVSEVIDGIAGTHVLLDTSGYGDPGDFRELIGKVQLVFFDLKLVDDELHRQYTGQSNALILENLKILRRFDVPFVIRVPLIPGVTDTSDNLEAIAETVRGSSSLLRVDLLPYNRAAGGKYQAVGRQFSPGFDEQGEIRADVGIFTRRNLPVRLLS